jgi:AraC family ethanolamine operon transcriptional activator
MSSQATSEVQPHPSDVPCGESFAFALKTHDFDQLAVAVQGWNPRYRQLTPGRFDGELHAVQVNGILVARYSVNRVIQARGANPGDCYTLVPVSATNAAASWSGRSLKPGAIIILRPGQEHDHRATETETIAILSVPDSLLRRTAHGALGCDLEDLLAGRFALAAGPATGNTLQARLTRLLDCVATYPELLRHPAALKSLEEECLGCLVQVLSLAERDDKAGNFRVPNTLKVVRRAEEYMRAHLREPVTLSDLCREAGVSERTVLYSFREVLGMSPKAYFKAKRLNGLRRDLKSANPACTTVAEVAGQWGFWHTGNLAADYLRLFGELPSDTLGRGQVDCGFWT